MMIWAVTRRKGQLSALSGQVDKMLSTVEDYLKMAGAAIRETL